MQRRWFVLFILVTLTLTACGRSGGEVNFQNIGRTALNEMLGFELQLPNNTEVFVEGERASELRFANITTEDAVNLIMPQFQTAGFTLSKTGNDQAMDVLYTPGTTPSFIAVKDDQRFNIVFQPDFGDATLPLQSIGIVKE